MPYANIRITKTGATAEQKAAVIKGVTEVLVKVLGKDPASTFVVIDEVAGQMIALLSGPFWIYTWWSIFTAFLLFRIFDIWKPYPIRRLERLESGLGIMADDVLAGVYALIVNSVLISTYLLLFPTTG